MTREERVVDKYVRACKLAELAMDKKVAWNDPLAFWELVEAIVNFEKWGKNK